MIVHQILGVIYINIQKLLQQQFSIFQYSIKQNLNLNLISQNVSENNKHWIIILFKNISTQYNSTGVLLEIKSDKSCIESFQTEIDKFLFELSDGILTVVL